MTTNVIDNSNTVAEANKTSEIKNIVGKIATDKEFRQAFVDNPEAAFQSEGYGPNTILRYVLKELVKAIWASEFPHFMFGC